jgi:hypothetical protein
MLRLSIVNQLARATLAKLAELNLGSMQGAAALQKTARQLMRGSARNVLLPGTLGAFGAGLAVGAGLGVLFAPKSGAEMRALLLARLRGKTNGAARGIRIVPRVVQGASGAARPSNGGNGAGA